MWLANLCSWQICAFGRFSLLADFRGGQIFAVGRFVLLSDICCGQMCVCAWTGLYRCHICLVNICVVGRFFWLVDFCG